MAADTKELFIDRGATFLATIELEQENKEPIDLTGYTASLKFASTWGGTPALTLTSSPAAGLTITADSGLIAVVATDEQTATLTEDVYYAKLEITLSGAIYREARFVCKMQA
jgi:hypothetical protein